MNRQLRALVLGMTCLFAMLAARAQTPPYINYQGRLTDAQGQPMQGPRNLTFNFFDSPSGGTPVWGPQAIGGVPVALGYFNVALGPADASNRPILGAFSGNRYLEITVDGVPVQPRQQVLTAPYSANGNPPGTVLPYAGGQAPAGYLLCDGSAVSRRDFAGLFSAIGTAFGSGDGSTTFNLPDMRARFPRGVEAGAQVGQAAGSDSHGHGVSVSAPP